MAYLINRNTSRRMPCLHGIARYIQAAFGSNEFTIRDLKFDKNAKFNVHMFSPCAIRLHGSDYITCRYLENPHSPARCALVQSVEYDPQKSKLASDIMNALDGLNIVNRVDGSAKLTEFGKKFAKTRYDSEQWLELAQQAVLSYGPFVGMLHACMKNQENNIIRRSSLTIGYPITNETINIDGRAVTLSTGSQADTNTRTRSILTSFAVNTGFLLPKDHLQPSHESLWHMEVNASIMAKDWLHNQFIFYKEKVPPTNHVLKPLSYTTLTKNTRSLRERGQASVREATVESETKIRNRRFIICYLFNYAAKNGRKVNFSKMVNQISNFPDFVINRDDFRSIMALELPIATLAGIPFVITDDGEISPKTTVDISVLSKGAPTAIIELAQNIVGNSNFYG